MNKNVVHVIGFILVCFGAALITHYALNYFQTSNNPTQQNQEELLNSLYYEYELKYKEGYIDGSLNMVDAYDPKKDTKLIKSEYHKRRIEDSIKFRNKIITNK